MAQGHAEPGHPLLDIGGQPRLAAEQMGAAGDVEDQPVGRIERDHRRVADAAVGDPFEPGLVGRLVAVEHDQLGHSRPRIGQGHSRLQPQSSRRLVNRGQPERALHLLE